MIVIVDEPTLSREEGSMIAAPYNSKIMSEVLPYLGYLPDYTGENDKYKSVSLGNYVGMSIEDAKTAIKKAGLSVEVIGEGYSVNAQMPSAGTEISVSSGKVLLYASGDGSEKTVTVPDLIGKSVDECKELLSQRGLNVNLSGTPAPSSCFAVKQYPEANATVRAGAVINVEFRISESDDHTHLQD